MEKKQHKVVGKGPTSTSTTFSNRVAFTAVCLHAAHPLSLMAAENEMFRESLDNGRVAKNTEY